MDAPERGAATRAALQFPEHQHEPNPSKTYDHLGVQLALSIARPRDFPLVSSCIGCGNLTVLLEPDGRWGPYSSLPEERRRILELEIAWVDEAMPYVRAHPEATPLEIIKAVGNPDGLRVVGLARHAIALAADERGDGLPGRGTPGPRCRRPGTSRQAAVPGQLPQAPLRGGGRRSEAEQHGPRERPDDPVDPDVAGRLDVLHGRLGQRAEVAVDRHCVTARDA